MCWFGPKPKVKPTVRNRTASEQSSANTFILLSCSTKSVSSSPTWGNFVLQNTGAKKQLHKISAVLFFHTLVVGKHSEVSRFLVQRWMSEVMSAQPIVFCSLSHGALCSSGAATACYLLKSVWNTTVCEHSFSQVSERKYRLLFSSLLELRFSSFLLTWTCYVPFNAVGGALTKGRRKAGHTASVDYLMSHQVMNAKLRWLDVKKFMMIHNEASFMVM